MTWFFAIWPALTLELSRNPPLITKTLLSLGKFQGSEAAAQEPETKASQILYYTTGLAEDSGLPSGHILIQ